MIVKLKCLDNIQELSIIKIAVAVVWYDWTAGNRIGPSTNSYHTAHRHTFSECVPWWLARTLWDRIVKWQGRIKLALPGDFTLIIGTQNKIMKGKVFVNTEAWHIRPAWELCWVLSDRASEFEVLIFITQAFIWIHTNRVRKALFEQYFKGCTSIQTGKRIVPCGGKPCQLSGTQKMTTVPNNHCVDEVERLVHNLHVPIKRQKYRLLTLPSLSMHGESISHLAHSSGRYLRSYNGNSSMLDMQYLLFHVSKNICFRKRRRQMTKDCMWERFEIPCHQSGIEYE